LTEDGAAEKAMEEGKVIVGGANAETKQEKKIEVSEEQQSIV
jgi:hypothetical protein